MALPIITSDASTALGYEDRTVWPFELQPEHPFFSGAILLRRAFTLDPVKILESVEAETSDLGVPFRVPERTIEDLRARQKSSRGLFARKPESLTLEIEVNGILLGLFAGPEKVTGEAAESLDQGAMGKDARSLEKTSAVVAVTENGVRGESGPSANFDRAAAVTLLLSTVADLTSPIAVVWERTQQAAPAARLPKGYNLLLEDRVPCDLWSRWITVEPPSDADGLMPGLRTFGLASLLGMEIEFLVGKVDPEEQMQLIEAAAGVLIEANDPAHEVKQRLDDGALITGRLIPERGEDGAPRYVLGDFDLAAELGQL